MNAVAPRAAEKTAIRTQLGAIFVSLELSRSTWLVTSLSPGGGEKMSKHSVRAGDVAGLLERFVLHGKSVRQDWRDLPDHCHSGGRSRRVLAPSCAMDGG